MTNDVQLVVRLPSPIVDKLDALAKEMSGPGLTIKRATVLRMLVMEGLEGRRRSKNVAR